MSSHLILLGTASSGKSTLAKRISKHLNSSLIDLDTLAPHFSIDLLAGRQVSQEQILEATLKLVLNDNMRLTGFVIDAIEQEPYTTSLIETLTLNNFNPLVIYLDISNEALSRRIKGFRADPVTGITYPARQIQQSISSFAPKVIVEPEEGDEKDEKEEEIKDQDADNAEQDENAVKEIIDIDLADLINEESTPPNSKQTKPKLSNKSSWEIIPKEILDRVIIPAPTIIQSSLLKYPNSIIIDATQHPDVVFNDSLFRLNSINVFPYNHVPKSISTEVKGKTDEDILKMYSNPSDEPRRQISDFGKYCPVDLSNGLLTVGNYSIAASYKSKFYFFANEANQALFLAWPGKYLSPPHLPSLRLWVIGAPLSGKTTISKLIAKAYNLTYVNVDDILSEWESVSDQVGLLEKNPVYKKVFKRCRSGKGLSSAIIAEVITHVIGDSKSWVIDGGPRSLEQTKAFIENGLTPTFTINLKGDTKERVQNVKVFDSWVSESYINQKFYESINSNFNLETPNIIKTLEESSIKTIEIPIENEVNSNLSQVMETVDPFLSKAIPLSNAKITQLGDFEFGIVKDYCIVTLSKGLLVKGNSSQVAMYKNCVYYFINEDAKLQFVSEPQKFVKPDNEIVLPPLRVCVIGPLGSGKSNCCKLLSEESGVPHIDFDDYLAAHLAKLDAEELADVQKVIDETGIPSSDVLNDIAKNIFTMEPLSTSGFIIENFPKSKAGVDFMNKQLYHVDAVVHLKVDSDVLVSRKTKELTKTYAKMQVTQPEKAEEAQTTEIEAFSDIIDKQISKAAEVFGAFELISSVKALEVDSNRFLRPVLNEVKEKMKPCIQYRKSLISTARAIEIEAAAILLECGSKSLSAYGKYCPVTCSRHKIVSKSCTGYLPVQHLEFVYYLRTEKERDEFLLNTFHYVNDLQPPKPFVKPSIFVLGPSKSGKTIAAERLSKELDLVYLTIPIIIQGILDGAEDTDLYDNIKSNLLSGNSIPEDLIVEAVSIITKRGLCQAKGWVLDGYPYTHEQASELECHGVIPHLIFNLDVDQDEMINRCGIDLIRNQQDNIQRVDEGIAILRNQVYTENIEKIKTLYNDKYSNWISIDKNCSKWATFNIIKQEVESSIIRRQLYILKKHQGKAARIWGIGVNNYEIKSRMSPVFLDYCSVTLKDKMEIVKGAEGTRFMSEYSELYYNMSSQDALDSFMGSPDRYVDGVLPELPARAKPEEVTDPFPEGIELKGYCPVTLSDGPVGFESIHFGGRENVVIYKDKKYAMLNAEKAERFMRQPWKYINLVLPKKLPPIKVNIPIANLPVVGYLEQELATKINEGLRELGKFKPKYPFKDLRESACTFLGTYLKANNPKAKEWLRKSNKLKLDRFKDECELISYLSRKMEERVYIPPIDREAGFDEKLKAFFALRASSESE